ncbi:hypothetical protein DACRYDRAFT_103838 [Dacryopinax primogenitus]|uniref:BTB domain-containing protein n=1 Tax=Dacryopinax primogenitus (strain DJM 731) TaxID=1858805 RepID=M5G997_DACPD|nr:uncharacterized protein DACRYDRAFT_103838 [Dacryopinax primogenitus]EJU05349.1 hypothetical protein DACRYDRAFT_103838 [Dacryopinax primogenitus]
MAYTSPDGPSIAGPSRMLNNHTPSFMNNLHPPVQNGHPYASPPETPETTPHSTGGSDEAGHSQTSYYQSTTAAYHNEEILGHLYHTGFQMGNYSDINLHIEKRQYRLHALILARSTTLAHLMSTASHSSPQTIYISLSSEPFITEEGFSIALGFLYASVSLQLVTPQNALSVLASACYLGGMEDMAAHAYAVCKSGISLETLPTWMQFVSSISNDDIDAKGSLSCREKNRSSEHRSILGDYGERLKDDVMHYFIAVLPIELGTFEPRATVASPNTSTPAASPGRPSGYNVYLHLYTSLPFTIFKLCIESPVLPAPSDHVRFNFAKACVAARKPGLGRDSEETVVLAFGTEGGSAVCLARKTRKKALWKVTK